MSAVWRASRAAVKRRRLQTIVIGIVVFCSTVTVTLTLALLSAASSPFDRAFDKQHGAHVVAAFDPAKVSNGQLTQTARQPSVRAAAGPFGQTILQIAKDWHGTPAGPLTVVGRADPAGPVDRVNLLIGRWATAPAEIVINLSHASNPNPDFLGSKIEAVGAPSLTVVGFANSMSQSAGAWVTPEQMTTLHPTATQMLYRLTKDATDQQLTSGMAEATAGLPEGSLTATRSYLSIKQAFAAQADAYLPFMSVFGVLGLIVSALIVANVVSGAVISGYRHIGVLKALGFTGNQVVAVYLVMVSVPAAVGCAVGTLLGNLLARPILQVAFNGIQTGTATIAVSPWVPVICLVGMPTLVVITALIPALRAHRLAAAQAIAAGSAPRTGRGLRIQRLLSTTRLPRPISLGLGQPLARPGRAALTTAAIGVGVATVTLATGLTSTIVASGSVGRTNGAVINIQVGTPENGQPTPTLSDPNIEARLRSLPGAKRVTARGLLQVYLEGYNQTRFANVYRGDTPVPFLAPPVEGRWPDGINEAVAGPTFLTQHGLAIGDQITMQHDGQRIPLTIVGKLMDGNARAVNINWQTLTQLAPDTNPIEYYVKLAPDANAQTYMNAVKATDPGLHPTLVGTNATDTPAVVGLSSVFTVLLAIVAALGVFNTVLLNIRERRRDLGMLKSIGMTPRQVITMTLTSVAALGAVGGLLGIPLGVITHRLLVDNVGVIVFPESMKDVWHAPQLVALALAGVVIAILGALIPARSAARLTIAKVLHNE